MARVGSPTDGDGGFSALDRETERQNWNLLFLIVGMILLAMAGMAAVTVGYGIHIH